MKEETERRTRRADAIGIGSTRRTGHHVVHDDGGARSEERADGVFPRHRAYDVRWRGGEECDRRLQRVAFSRCLRGSVTDVSPTRAGVWFLIGDVGAFTPTVDRVLLSGFFFQK
jgi:hypothetical protein